MTAHQRSVSASIDPVKLDRLAEVAIRVGLQLQPGQDLLLTAPSVALPLVRKIAEHAYKAGAGIVTPFLSDEEITLARYRYGHNESFDRAAGWLYEGMAKAFSRQHRAARHRRRQSDAAVGRGPGKGGARQQGQFDRLSAGAGEDRQFRHQLEHHCLSEPVLGQAGLPRCPRGCRGGKTGGRDLCGLAGRSGRRRRGLGKAQRGAARAHRLAERPALSRAEIFRARHRPHDRSCRRPRMGRRRLHREERHHLQRQHPDRGSLHHAALPARQRPCRLLEAAVAIRAP